eukprot:67827-Amphidinium_carterae.1
MAVAAGSPLFLTDMNPAFMMSEIQFVLSGPLNGLFEVAGTRQCFTIPPFLMTGRSKIFF